MKSLVLRFAWAFSEWLRYKELYSLLGCSALLSTLLGAKSFPLFASEPFQYRGMVGRKDLAICYSFKLDRDDGVAC